MPNLSEYTEIKKMVAKMIINDRTCVDLITDTNGTEPLPAARLIQTKNAINQIHLYDFIPGVTESAKVHVCVEVYDFPPTSVAVGIYELCIYCIVPDELMAMDGAVRRDELVAAIDKLLNNKAGFWFGTFERLQGKCSQPVEGFRCRALRYRVEAWNNHGETLNADR